MSAETSSRPTFVSDPLKPVVGTADLNAMAAGSPALPREFTWRGKPLRISKVNRFWRETGPCKHGGGEVYARKHWFEVETESGQLAQIYFERQPRGGNKTKRWWLFSING